MFNNIISFEQAKLAKQLGFDDSCFYAYDVNGVVYECYYTDDYISYISNSEIINATNPAYKLKGGYAAPLQPQLLKWFRDYQNINIVVEPIDNIKGQWYYIIQSIRIYHKNNDIFLYSKETYDCYEETLENAITEILKYLVYET